MFSVLALVVTGGADGRFFYWSYGCMFSVLALIVTGSADGRFFYWSYGCMFGHDNSENNIACLLLAGWLVGRLAGGY